MHKELQKKLGEIAEILAEQDCDVAVVCCTHILKARIKNQVQLDRAARAIKALVGETNHRLYEESFANTAEAAGSLKPETLQPCGTLKTLPQRL